MTCIWFLGPLLQYHYEIKQNYIKHISYMLKLTNSTDNGVLESPFLTPRAYVKEMKSIFHEFTTSIVFWRNIIIVRFFYY